MPRRTFILPSGKTTTSPDLYVKTWRKLAKPLTRRGYKLYGFDPGFLFVSHINGLVDIPVEIMGIIADMDEHCA